MLSITGLGVTYGGLHALTGVTLEVGAGEFVTLVGPNGAGKTTLLKAISGTVAASEGRVAYQGRDVARLRASERAARRRRTESLATVLELFPILRERERQLAGSLSGGEQQMLALGRGLMAQPELLLLDEPSQGLGPRIVEQIFETIDRIRRERRLTVLLVEQRVVEALELCDRGYVLETGRVVLAGDRDALLADPRVQRAYLGG